MVSEAWRFIQLAVPAVAISTLQLLPWTYTQSFIGTKFGSEALGGVALALLSGNLTGLSIVIGFLSACDTMLPQAFAQQQYKEFFRIAVRGFFISVVLVMGLVPFWLNIDAVLIAVKQPRASALLAQRFLSLFCLSFPGITFIEVAQRFYRAQNVILPFIFTSLASFLAHPFFLSMFCDWYGFDGAPLAHCATVYLNCVITMSVIVYSDFHHPKTIMPHYFSPSFLHDTFVNDRPGMYQIIKLGLPGIFSTSEWWYWETICFISGLFGEASLAAHSIAYSIIPLLFMVPLGFSVAITVRVGALVAEKRVTEAKHLGWRAVFVCAAIVLFNGLLVFAFRESIVQFYTKDPQVEDLCHQIWPYVFLFIVQDGFMGTVSGLIRALGRQAAMSRALLLSLWLLGIPAILLNAIYRELHLVGVWQCMGPIYLLLNALLIRDVVKLDWQAYADSIAAGSKLNKAKLSDREIDIH